MLIDKIIDRSQQNSITAYYSFETFVLNILRHHVESQGKRFLVERESQLEFGDAYAADGFDEYQGPTAIEVKLSIDRLRLRKLISIFIRRLESISAATLNIKNIIIVVARKIATEEKKKFLADIEELQLSVNFIIWDEDDLSRITSKHRTKRMRF